MTPQTSTPSTGQHLTEEQFGELVERSTASAETSEADQHLARCEQCREELNSTREAVLLFRDIAAAFAEREFGQSQHVKTSSFVPMHRGFSHGLLWAAAGLLVIAGALPLELHRQDRPVPQPNRITANSAMSGESDEALLEDISRELSASVPAPMQALADPTGNTSASADVPTSTTRKN